MTRAPPSVHRRFPLSRTRRDVFELAQNEQPVPEYSPEHHVLPCE